MENYMELTTKGKLTLTDNVYNQILTQISTGIYSSGEKLPSERELCEEYGVSRICIRSALQRLEALGIIETLHGKGSFITGIKRATNHPLPDNEIVSPYQLLSLGEYEEFWPLRYSLESQAFKLFIPRATEEDFNCLDELIRKIIDSSTQQELALVTFNYHNYIFENCGNRYIANSMFSYENIYRASLYTIQTLRKQTRGVVAQHHIFINNAMRNKDINSVLKIITEENTLLLKANY